jgi:hypothetical protein
MITLEKSPMLHNFVVNPLFVDISDLAGTWITPDFAKIDPSNILAANVLGREWYDKANGNSYNDFCIVFVLKGGNETVCIYGEIGYGYGDYYMQRARGVLKVLNLFGKIPLFGSKQENCKKAQLLNSKDLKKWGSEPIYKLLKELGIKNSQEV